MINLIDKIFSNDLIAIAISILAIVICMSYDRIFMWFANRKVEKEKKKLEKIAKGGS